MAPQPFDGFVAARSPVWAELEELLGRGDRLTPIEVLRLVAAYRGTAADLALARRCYAGDPLIAALEEQVIRARDAVAGVPPRADLAGLLHFATRGWWQLVAASWRWTVAAGILLTGALAAATTFAVSAPEAAARTLPLALQRVPLAGGRGVGAVTGLPRGLPALDASWTAGAALALAVLALVGGLLAGTGTVVVLAATGLQLGVPAGLALRDGHGGRVLWLFLANGLVLLLAVCVVAGQGLRIGAAVVEPGFLPRRPALVGACRRGAVVLCGALPLFAVGAALQAAVRLAGAATVAPVGLALALLLPLGVVLLGRPTTGATASRHRQPRSRTPAT